MYKLLLCWRYLRTRYIALASVISVTLGVATMIVVNAVMEGFTHEMQNRMHGILSDISFESHSMEGFRDAAAHMAKIREIAGKYIQAMTPTVHVPALLRFQYGNQWVTRPVQLIGVDELTKDQVGDFGKYLTHARHREKFDFQLQENGYDAPAAAPDAKAFRRPELATAGWQRRRRRVAFEREWDLMMQKNPTVGPAAQAVDNPLAEAANSSSDVQQQGITNPASNPFDQRPEEPEGRVFDPGKEQHTGIVLGIILGSFRDEQAREDRFLVLPGDDVKLTFPTAGTPPRAADSIFTIVDFYESKMSEYDSTFAFVPIRTLQEMRGMIEPSTGIGYANAIQIKLKNERDGNTVRDLLRAAFPPQMYGIHTWRDKQGPLLAAVQMETSILNVLLFLIIAVAGFGILAIFFMIVVEKTRDIGILKSLGASGRGIMGIFLTYGLSLGMVGSGVGLVLGLLFVAYINEIAGLLSQVTGHEVFDPNIYYFQQIPTIIETHTVCWIVLGALAIAVLASILPARRASRLHPVEALRYE